MGLFDRISNGSGDGSRSNGGGEKQVRHADPEPHDDARYEPAQVMGPTPDMRERMPSLAPQPGGAGEREDKGATVMSFANQKGGVAKTTTTLNLAVAFRESGHRVMCVDLDPQGNLTMSQGIDPDKVEKSMYDVLVDKL